MIHIAYSSTYIHNFTLNIYNNNQHFSTTIDDYDYPMSYLYTLKKKKNSKLTVSLKDVRVLHFWDTLYHGISPLIFIQTVCVKCFVKRCHKITKLKQEDIWCFFHPGHRTSDQLVLQ